MAYQRGCRVLGSTRAQSTLFIILGILILGGVTVYIITTEKISLPEGQVEEQQEIPSQFSAVQIFVENCIAKTAEDGLIKIGHSGGYIEPRRYGIISDPADPTQAGSVRFDPGNENTATVFWWHFESPNTCTKDCRCASERPNLRKVSGEPSIEGQLARYINENLASCIQDFSSLKRDGFVVQELAGPTSNAVIIDEGVFISVNYPVRVVLESAEVSLRQFRASVDIPLARIYELASKITNTQIKYPFLERWTLEQVSAFGLGPDADALPPTSVSVFDPSKKPEHWEKSDAKNLLQYSILPYYTGFLQVWQSSNYDERANYYQKATVPINESYADIRVNFEYLSWWPIYFDIKGRGVRGNFIGPETAGIAGLFSWLGLQRYDFYYDVSYPVRVDIYDPSALNNRGYHFMFNLEANLRGNKPINCSGSELPVTLPPTGTLLCDPRLACANITMELAFGISLDDIQVSYGHEEDSCVVIRENATVALPQCVGEGCTLHVSRYDIFSVPQSLSVRCDLPSGHPTCRQKNVACNKDSVAIESEAFRVKNISVQKLRNIKQKDGWALDLSAFALQRNEYASVTLQKIKQNQAEQDVVVQAVYYGNQSSTQVAFGLVPGKYKVTIELIYGFPDAKGATQVVFKDKEINGQKVHVDPFTGAFSQGTTSFEWTLGKELLDSSGHIVFYAISSPDSASFGNLDVEDLKQIGSSEALAVQYRSSIEPTFK